MSLVLAKAKVKLKAKKLPPEYLDSYPAFGGQFAIALQGRLDRLLDFAVRRLV